MSNLFTEEKETVEFNAETGEIVTQVSDTIVDQVNGIFNSGDATSEESRGGFQADEVLEQIRMLSEQEGNVRWQIADLIDLLTLGCNSSKDRNLILEYVANETNIETVTVRQYSWMAKAYPTGPIREISPFLTWSHYRACAGAATIEERREWLEKAADNTWSVAFLKEQIAQSAETAAIKIGTPCSRMGCTCEVSDEPGDRVIANAYGYKLVCCSVACLANIVVNGLTKIRARILGEVEPVDGMTPLLAHPDKEKRDSTSQGSFEKLRNDTEKIFFAERLQRQKAQRNG